MAIDDKSGHYDTGGLETLIVHRAKLTPEQFKGYLLGNIIKYACRLNFKDQALRDAEKICVYANELKQELEKMQEEKKRDKPILINVTPSAKPQELICEYVDVCTYTPCPHQMPYKRAFGCGSFPCPHRGDIRTKCIPYLPMNADNKRYDEGDGR